MKWYLYILIASLFYTSQNVYRKKLYNDSNISSEKSWSFVLIGLLIGVIASLMYVCLVGNIGDLKLNLLILYQLYLLNQKTKI